MKLYLNHKVAMMLFVASLSGNIQTSDAQSASRDTLQINLREAEKIVLDKNLSALAARYNIDANKALVRQAKLWDNLVLNTDQNIYDGKFFRHDASGGQVYVQVMQLIHTAGKLNKAAQLALDNTTLSEIQFDELMRTLRYTVRNDLEEASHLLKIKNVYNSEILEVEKLVKGMDEAFKTGDIALKDNIRVKALLFSLQNESNITESQLIQLQLEIRTLLQTNENIFIKPVLSYKFGELTKAELSALDSLKHTALECRTDIRMANASLEYQNHNLIYQRSLAKPDVSAGIEYDRLSSYAPNYFGLALSIPLPVFNRNQGNIKAAQFSVKSQQALSNQVKSNVENEVLTAYKKVLFQQHINNEAQLEFSKDYDKLFQNMLNSYKERQLGLLEFIDFMDAYKDTKLKLTDQHHELIKSIEELNYAIGKDIININ